MFCLLRWDNNINNTFSTAFIWELSERISLKCLLQCHIIISTYILSNIIFNFWKSAEWKVLLLFILFVFLNYFIGHLNFCDLWVYPFAYFLYWIFFFCLLYQKLFTKYICSYIPLSVSSHCTVENTILCKLFLFLSTSPTLLVS